ncbi:DUF5684 domain-containing protein [Flavobacterium sp. NKUCC04_CG]|uniref:DUF5684 domain-containing protein n=1 Tax=Flavobacterium sp. NKUCC04_CG TaxID=2842121 RepID=UPI001C5AFEB4|nr:DUF5684 domain-containing protein [Flavobacterium sp. NKUCC04_CG]MBW3519776.1 hypothetical protein [Flavobacterium sp. NKUCC04_CG]
MNEEIYTNDAIAAGAAGIGMIGFIIYLAVIILIVAAQWKIFAKAGKPGWAAIIPIYNIIVLLEIIGKPLWWIFLFLIPGVNIIFMIWTYNLLSKSFGKTEGFTVGIILLPFIFLPILGFGDAKYIGPAGAEGTNPSSTDRV